MLPFYGRGATRQSDAATFTVGPGQERSGEDLTIPLAKLHRMTGVVVARRDGHKVAAGKVVLACRDDGKEVATAEVSREDGTSDVMLTVPEKGAGKAALRGRVRGTAGGRLWG